MESTQGNSLEKCTESAGKVMPTVYPLFASDKPVSHFRNSGSSEIPDDFSDFADYFIASSRILMAHKNGRRSLVEDSESDMLSL